MYTEADLTSIQAQQKKRWLVLALPEAALLAAMVVSLVIRMEWLTTLLTCLMFGLLIFCYELLIKPLHCYEKHLRGVLQGRNRVLEGTFKSAEEALSVVDGVAYHAMTVADGDPTEEENDRLFYYDAEKGMPPVHPGDRVRVTFHDREVGGLERL